MSELGGLIRRKRKILGLSQREVAQLANVSRSYVSELESGSRRTDSLEILSSISRSLQLPIKDVLAAAGYDCNEGHVEPGHEIMPPEVQYLHSVIARSQPPYRDELVKSVRELATAWAHLVGISADEQKEGEFRHDAQPESEPRRI